MLNSVLPLSNDQPMPTAMAAATIAVAARA
jgi:hypothetical protein